MDPVTWAAIIGAIATLGAGAVGAAILGIPDRQQANAIKAANKYQKGLGDYAWKLAQREKLQGEIKTGDPKKLKIREKALAKLDKSIAKRADKFPGVTANTVTNPQAAQQLGKKGPEGNEWNGYRPYTDQLPLLSPEQVASQNQLLPGLTNQLMNNEQSFEPKAQAIRQNYQKYTEPALAERLNFGGIQGPQYANALASGRADLESNIGAQGVDYAQQNRTQQQNLYSTLMNRNFENIYYPGQSGLKKEALSALIEHGGEAAREYGPQLLKAGAQGVNNWLNPQQQTNPTFGPEKKARMDELLGKKNAYNEQQQAKQQAKLAANVLGGNAKKNAAQGQFNDVMRNNGYVGY